MPVLTASEKPSSVMLWRDPGEKLIPLHGTRYSKMNLSKINKTVLRLFQPHHYPPSDVNSCDCSSITGVSFCSYLTSFHKLIQNTSCLQHGYFDNYYYSRFFTKPEDLYVTSIQCTAWKKTSNMKSMRYYQNTISTELSLDNTNLEFCLAFLCLASDSVIGNGSVDISGTEASCNQRYQTFLTRQTCNIHPTELSQQSSVLFNYRSAAIVSKHYYFMLHSCLVFCDNTSSYLYPYLISWLQHRHCDMFTSSHFLWRYMTTLLAAVSRV